MRAFICESCKGLVYFENTLCTNCDASLGYVRSLRKMVSLFKGQYSTPKKTWTRCANFEAIGCNWLTVLNGPTDLCDACDLTRTRPHDGDPAGIRQWADAEAAKRRLMYQLDQLALPVDSFREKEGGLGFDLLKPTRDEPVVTGHAEGLITVDLSETSDPHREALRVQLDEAYRTMLGHFRHEVGHYYWNVLVRDRGRTESFRALFGDESEDYSAALDKHYKEGSPKDWQENYLSHYATTHPWEDFAETFAHYLHIRDTLQTAAAFGISVDGPVAAWPEQRITDLNSAPKLVASADTTIDDLLADWHPLSLALNQVNRSMGHDDLYPFVIPLPVVAKLGYVHWLVTGQGEPAQDAG